MERYYTVTYEYKDDHGDQVGSQQVWGRSPGEAKLHLAQALRGLQALRITSVR